MVFIDIIRHVQDSLEKENWFFIIKLVVWNHAPYLVELNQANSNWILNYSKDSGV